MREPFSLVEIRRPLPACAFAGSGQRAAAFLQPSHLEFPPLDLALFQTIHCQSGTLATHSHVSNIIKNIDFSHLLSILPSRRSEVTGGRQNFACNLLSKRSVMVTTDFFPYEYWLRLTSCCQHPFSIQLPACWQHPFQNHQLSGAKTKTEQWPNQHCPT